MALDVRLLLPCVGSGRRLLGAKIVAMAQRKRHVHSCAGEKKQLQMRRQLNIASMAGEVMKIAIDLLAFLRRGSK